jgi:hypothetical protein
MSSQGGEEGLLVLESARYVNLKGTLMWGKDCKTLREFQKLQGWVNWALNVFSYLHPALCESFQKIVGKACPNASIQVDDTVR